MISKLIPSIGIAEFVAIVYCYSDCDGTMRQYCCVFVCATSMLGLRPAGYGLSLRPRHATGFIAKMSAVSGA